MLDWHDPLMLDHRNMASMMPISTLKKAAHCIAFYTLQKRTAIESPASSSEHFEIFRTGYHIYIYVLFCTYALCMYIFACICSMWTCINESNPLCHSPLSRLQPQKDSPFGTLRLCLRQRRTFVLRGVSSKSRTCKMPKKSIGFFRWFLMILVTKIYVAHVLRLLFGKTDQSWWSCCFGMLGKYFLRGGSGDAPFKCSFFTLSWISDPSEVLQSQKACRCCRKLRIVWWHSTFLKDREGVNWHLLSYCTWIFINTHWIYIRTRWFTLTCIDTLYFTIRKPAVQHVQIRQSGYFKTAVSEQEAKRSAN